jgi:hypothetical protein
MRRTIKAATAANSREMEIISEDLTRVFHTDEHCVAMLVNEMPVWLSPRVCFEVVDALCGYKRELARVMALNLIDFWQGFGDASRALFMSTSNCSNSMRLFVSALSRTELNLNSNSKLSCQ